MAIPLGSYANGIFISTFTREINYKCILGEYTSHMDPMVLWYNRYRLDINPYDPSVESQGTAKNMARTCEWFDLPANPQRSSDGKTRTNGRVCLNL